VRPLKSLLSNGLATMIDFATAGTLVHVVAAQPSLATLAGCAAGSVVSFALARIWVFATPGAGTPQATRFAFVSSAGAVLNAGGVALLVGLGAPFVLAWLLARVVVFSTWSYPAQRDFVFAGSNRHSGPALVTRH
jgi:putative flippase GtrA